MSEGDKQIQKSRGQLWLDEILTDERSQAVEKIVDGTGVTMAQMQGSLMEAALSNPDIMEAKPASVFRSVLQAARLGVVPSGMRNGAYYSIYAGECKLGLGYGALTELAVRFGNVRRYTTAAVYPADDFYVEQGTSPSIKHCPNHTSPTAQAYAYYAIAWFEDGSFEFEVMRRDQIDHVKSKSRNQNGPWKSDYDEMAKKTVLLRLHKRIPMPAVVSEAVEIANEADGYDFPIRRGVRNEASTIDRVLPGRDAEEGEPDAGEPTDEQLANQPDFDPSDLDIPEGGGAKETMF